MHSISTEKAPAAIGPYSQGVVVNGLLFASGQIALSPETGELVGSTIEEQAEQVMKNVGALLTAAGTDFDHVVKTPASLRTLLISLNLMQYMQNRLAKSFPLVPQSVSTSSPRAH